MSVVTNSTASTAPNTEGWDQSSRFFVQQMEGMRTNDPLGFNGEAGWKVYQSLLAAEA